MRASTWCSTTTIADATRKRPIIAAEAVTRSFNNGEFTYIVHAVNDIVTKPTKTIGPGKEKSRCLAFLGRNVQVARSLLFVETDVV